MMSWIHGGSDAGSLLFLIRKDDGFSGDWQAGRGAAPGGRGLSLVVDGWLSGEQPGRLGAPSNPFCGLCGKRLGDRARRLAGGLRQHHRGVGGKVAVRRIARRFERHGLAVEPGRNRPRRLQRVERGVDRRRIGFKNSAHDQACYLQK